ncbi:unnamed protein product [Ranitomeya imitator]|uniref:Helix-turn-helix domain-containing protein n=1 Tax=Ranitomeya imitator TaxID=111125 RepID=A0ABN9LB80_9NEOB|nr:unnamed protein product [Ranitomeya imitator]
MKVLGRMVATLEAIPFAQFHSRPLQQAILSQWDRSVFSLDRPIRLSFRVKRSLNWWLTSPLISQGRSFLPVHWQVVTTDASLIGWGAVFRHLTVQGRWSPQESALPINVLEIRAIFLSLRHWERILRGLPVRIQTDNATAVAYVNHQGGTRSSLALAEVSKILLWAEATVPMISAVHIPGVENWAADFLSREGLAAGEWSLHPEVFHQICLRWGTPDVDLTASRINRKVPQFVSRSRDPLAVGVDALAIPWSQFELPYLFPPPSITSQTVEEDQSGRGDGHPDRPGLAQESLVRGARQPSRGRSLVPSRQARSAVPGSDLPPEFSVAQFNGVAVETAVLRASGLSDRVIHTMIQARKPSSSRIYYRTWKAYFRWCESNRVPPMVFSLPSLLAFLQAGLDSGLALSSLKGQVSALSILFQKTLASRPQRLEEIMKRTRKSDVQKKDDKQTVNGKETKQESVHNKDEAESSEVIMKIELPEKKVVRIQDKMAGADLPQGVPGHIVNGVQTSKQENGFSSKESSPAFEEVITLSEISSSNGDKVIPPAEPIIAFGGKDAFIKKSTVQPPQITGWWEESVVYQHVAFGERCLKWLRFIDDIVMFWAGTEEDCERFIADLNDNPYNIRLTSHISRTSVEFLDLKVSFAGSNVVTTLYRKPTATNSLLHYSSFHPRHLKNGIPTGQFLRLKRNCSLTSDFQDEARILTDRFRHRGYPKKVISSAYQRARTSVRSDLLQRQALRVRCFWRLRICFWTDASERVLRLCLLTAQAPALPYTSGFTSTYRTPDPPWSPAARTLHIIIKTRCGLSDSLSSLPARTVKFMYLCVISPVYKFTPVVTSGTSADSLLDLPFVEESGTAASEFPPSGRVSCVKLCVLSCVWRHACSDFCEMSFVWRHACSNFVCRVACDSAIYSMALYM